MGDGVVWTWMRVYEGCVSSIAESQFVGAKRPVAAAGKLSADLARRQTLLNLRPHQLRVLPRVHTRPEQAARILRTMANLETLPSLPPRSLLLRCHPYPPPPSFPPPSPHRLYYLFPPTLVFDSQAKFQHVEISLASQYAWEDGAGMSFLWVWYSSDKVRLFPSFISCVYALVSLIQLAAQK